MNHIETQLAQAVEKLLDRIEVLESELHKARGTAPKLSDAISSTLAKASAPVAKSRGDAIVDVLLDGSRHAGDRQAEVEKSARREARIANDPAPSAAGIAEKRAMLDAEADAHNQRGRDVEERARTGNRVTRKG